MAKSIYIHLPFCKTKCPYCDFASFTQRNDDYLAVLLKEIDESAMPQDKPIETVFFGGGTPSIHSAEEIKSILDRLEKHFNFSEDIEITLEANPGTVDKEKLAAFKEIGINRISFGAQSFDRKLLEKLGRGHSLEDTYETLENIIDLNFKSWSFDLIYGLPGQSPESWSQTIEEALKYNPPHISAYALSIEKNTPYGQIFKDSSHPDLPIEDDVIEMYKLAHEKFEEKGLMRYEISNWSKPEHEARHNLTYWHAEEYYAFGLSAHGYLNGKRYSNTRDINDYIENYKKHQVNTTLTKDEILDEQILLRMRLNEGLSLSSKASDRLNEEKLLSFIEKGLVIKAGEDLEKIKLSTDGLLLSNKIIAELIK